MGDAPPPMPPMAAYPSQNLTLPPAPPPAPRLALPPLPDGVPRLFLSPFPPPAPRLVLPPMAPLQRFVLSPQPPQAPPLDVSLPPTLPPTPPLAPSAATERRAAFKDGASGVLGGDASSAAEREAREGTGTLTPLLATSIAAVAILTILLCIYSRRRRRLGRLALRWQHCITKPMSAADE